MEAERAHQLRLGRALDPVTGLQAAEGPLSARIEPFGLVLACVDGGRQPDVGARGAHLKDARGVHQRQRDGRGSGVKVPYVGDRARVLGGGLSVSRRHLRAP